TYVLVATLKRADGDASGALVDLDSFLEEYAGNKLAPKAELERASAMDELGRHAEAAAAFQEFLNSHPDHPDTPQALYQRSWALWNQIRPRAQQAREAEARYQELTGGRDPSEIPEADRVEAIKARDDARSIAAEVKSSEDAILTSLRNLTERYPDYPVVDSAWLRIGEILYDRGEFQAALDAYREALALAERKNSQVADKAQYRMAWSIQRLAEAAERESLLEVQDGSSEKREALRKDMWDKRVAAIDAFEVIIGKYPNSDLVGDAAYRAAELRRRSGQDNMDAAKRSAWFQSAAQRYRQAIEKGGADAPYNLAAQYGEGLSLLLDDKDSQARDSFQRLLLRNQDGPYVQEAYWGLGQANLKLGAYADANTAFEQALAMEKATETAAKSRYGLALSAALAGDKEKARLEFLAVDTFYPNYPEWAAAALVRAARIALEDGAKDKAMGDLERVLARYADTPAAEEARDLQATLSAEG
ncbi:MAG: tetratricopeptide repeat protein, partial [Planctomycetes bacterium]|nr:tetratricopeptide repeat protein [Planctomycetota bacterium]